MSEILESINKILADEFLLRPPLVKYTIKDFMDMNPLLDKVINEGLSKECVEIVQNQLVKNNSSILSIYLLCLLQVRTKEDYQTHAQKFVSAFSQVKKNNLIVFLAKELLKYHESLFSLNLMVNNHQFEQNPDELLEIYERILKQDTNDYQLSLKIARIHEKSDRKSEAVRYYKMGFYRALEAKDGDSLLSVWDHLLDLNPDDFQFYLDNGKKLHQIVPEDKSGKILLKVYSHFSKDLEKNILECHKLAMEILSQDSKNIDFRSELVNVYREKYKTHSQLEDLIQFSGLTKPWKDVLEQVELFESLIRFDVGSFVFHKSFGYGVLNKIEMPDIKKSENINTTKLFIDFQKKKKHMMTLRIALGSLISLRDDHLTCLKAFNPEKLKTIINSNAEALITAIFHTTMKPVSANEIKSMMVPNLMDKEEWAEKWKLVKEEFSTNPMYEVKNKLFYFKTSELSYKEELKNNYFSYKTLDSKLKVCDLFLLNYNEDDEEFAPIKADIEKEYGKSNDKAFLALYMSYLIKHNAVEWSIKIESEIGDLLAKKDLPTFFDEIKINNLKHHLVDQIISRYPNDYEQKLKEIYLSPDITSKSYILDILFKNGKHDVLNQLMQKVFVEHKSMPEHYLLLSRMVFQNEAKNLSYNEGHVFIDLIDLLDSSYKDYQFSNENIQAKKIYQQANGILFDQSNLFTFLKGEGDAPMKKNIIGSLNKLSYLENYLKVEIKEIMTKIEG